MEENRELDEPKVSFYISEKILVMAVDSSLKKSLIATNIHIVAGATSISAERY